MPVAKFPARALLLAALAAGTASVPPALASPHAGVNAELYRPAVDTQGTLSLDSGRALEQYDMSLGIAMGYGHQPFRVAAPGIGDEGADTVLKFAFTLRAAFGFAFTDRLTLALDTGLYRADTDIGYGERGRYRPDGAEPSTGLLSLRPLTNIDPGGAQAHGLAGPLDARVSLKYQLLGAGKLSLAALFGLSVPFGDEEMFLGDAGFVLAPKLALDYAWSTRGAILVNLGMSIRRRTVLQAYDADALPSGLLPEDVALAVFDLGSELTAGLGGRIALGRTLTLEAAGQVFAPLPASFSYGSCQLADGSDCTLLDDDESMYFADAGYGDMAAHALGGLRWQVSPETTLSLGAGLGLVGQRGDQFRVMSGVLWRPTTSEARAAGMDQDSDGVGDGLDVCVDEPEDRDGFQDEDGCPEPDNDIDGVSDRADGCPGEPEDQDGFQDEDGCPELDNDADAVPDMSDRCPDQSEDADRFEDDDGCPDPDNDGDGIYDAVDRCPNEAGGKVRGREGDGCPGSLSWEMKEQ